MDWLEAESDLEEAIALCGLLESNIGGPQETRASDALRKLRPLIEAAQEEGEG